MAFSWGDVFEILPPHQYSTDSPVASGHRLSPAHARKRKTDSQYPLSFFFSLSPSACAVGVVGVYVCMKHCNIPRIYDRFMRYYVCLFMYIMYAQIHETFSKPLQALQLLGFNHFLNYSDNLHLRRCIILTAQSPYAPALPWLLQASG